MSHFPPKQLGTYRGGLVYTVEHGYLLITMTVSVVPDEQSQVITHAYNLPIAEEAEHVGSVDLYHFVFSEDTRIQLTIVSPTGTQEAWYMVSRHTVLAPVSSMYLDIVRSSASITYS